MRFPGFEGEWEENKLGDVAEISSGGTPTRNNMHFWNGNIPWVSTSLINFNTITTTEETITEEGLKKSSAKLFPKNSILMAMYGQGKTRGKVAILGIEASTNQACAAIIPKKDSLNHEFLFQNLSKRYDEIRELSNLGGQENLSGTIIKSIKIKMPLLEEQQKISSFLMLIDERISTQSKIIEELKSFHTIAAKYIFTKQLRFKSSSGKNYSEWQTISLGELGQTYNGLTGKTKDDFGIGKPYIQYKQIFDNSKIDTTRCELVNIIENENQYQVEKGDIFFTVSSETPEEIGMSSVLLDDVEVMYLNSFCFGYRPNSTEILSPSFARYLFRSVPVRNEIIKLAQGSTRYNMSKVSLMKLKVNLPCIEEQHQIANFLTSLDDKISIEQNLLEKLKVEKQFLLTNLFI